MDILLKWFVKKVKSAIIEVIEGRSEYERDGTVFIERPKNLEIRKLLKKIFKNELYSL